MSIDRSLERLDRAARVWLDALDSYSEEEFRRMPEPGSWTIGQVYQHLVDATMGLALPKLERCLDPDRPAEKGGKNLGGRLVFLLGGFPPVRIRFKPRPDYAPRQPESIAAAREALTAMVAATRAAAERARAAPPDRKSRHPALGHLNAAEWIDIVAMHTEHHFRQKRRIDRALRTAPTP